VAQAGGVHIVIILQEQTKTRVGWLVGHSNSWDIVVNRCWDMQSSVLDVGRCYRKVFMRVGNVSRSRRVNIPEFVFAKMDASSDPQTPHPKHPKRCPSHNALLDSGWYQEHCVRVVHVLRCEIGLAFTHLMSQRERVFHV